VHLLVERILMLSSTCFEQVIFHHQEALCTSSLQYFTMRLKRGLFADTIRKIQYYSYRVSDD